MGQKLIIQAQANDFKTIVSHYLCGTLPQANAEKTLNSYRNSPTRQRRNSQMRDWAPKRQQILSDSNPSETNWIVKKTKMFRALSAKYSYVLMDRQECAFSAKELCQQFVYPTKKWRRNVKENDHFVCKHASTGM